MHKLKHVVGVPLLLAATVALYFAYAVSLGFTNEGCRFPRDGSEFWPLVGDWAMIHGLFFVGFLLPVGGIVAVLDGVRLRGQSMGRVVAWLGLLAFAVAAISSLAYLLGCQGEFARILSPVSPVLRGISSITALSFLCAVLIGYVAGLDPSNQRAS